MKYHVKECLLELRQNISLIGRNAESSPAKTDTNNGNEKRQLQHLLDTTYRSITEQIKNVLVNLQAFIGTDISFSAKVHFNEPFCKQYVRELLVAPYLKHIAEVARDFATNPSGSPDPALLLVLTKLCLEFESVAIDYLLSLVDEQFFVDDLRTTAGNNGSAGGELTTLNKRELCDTFRQSAHLLINHYVRVRGALISQMIRKSVEIRDWLNTIEPRNVRAVMKRFIEDMAAIDIQVGELFEAGVRREKGSDSSRNTYTVSRQLQRNTAWSIAPRFGANSFFHKCC